MKRKLFYMIAILSVLSLVACSHISNDETSDTLNVTQAGKTDNEESNQEEQTGESENNEQKTEEEEVIEAYEVEKDGYSSKVSVHDPSIVKDGDTYYIFGSHMEAAKSANLYEWKSFAGGVNDSNPLFDGLFDSAAFDWVGLNTDGGYSVWAPDVIYNKKMEKYCMYFCTSHDWNTSSLCFATADSIEGPYVFQERLIDSGFVAADVEKTNLSEVLGSDVEDRGYWTASDYDSQKWPNAIDPTVFYDADGRLFMVYGSWSGGIFLLELDEETGLVIHPEDDPENGVDAYFGKHLLGYGHKSCEGPYIIYEEASGYYYLFVSYGALQREGGYNIRMFRSKNVDGPYEDAMGQTWTTATSFHSQFGVKVMGNYYMPSNWVAYMATGHCSLMNDDGKILLTYHTRFNSGSENHEPRVHQMFLNEDGWLVPAVFNYNTADGYDETISPDGYQKDEIVGDYYYLNHMTDTSNIIHEAEVIRLKADGTIVGSVSGRWEEVDGSYYANITIDNVTYKGVFFRQLDEGGHEVMTFSCISDQNTTIWGVKY